MQPSAQHTLQDWIQAKRSFLCVGLDTDGDRVPAHLGRGPEAMLAFNLAIADATLPYAVAYKINTAFYEAYGSEGWKVIEETAKALKGKAYLIADAKRGDIGNTAGMYARAFFENMPFDALTVNAYMGTDTLMPYLDYPHAHLFVLACTSNPGYGHFEAKELKAGNRLFEEIVIQCRDLAPGRLHFVAGATHASELARVRQLAPRANLLVPGVGAQGGNLQEVMQSGLNSAGSGLLINASRSVIYASSGTDFTDKAEEEARRLAQEMRVTLELAGF
jgi:orotidine-5'-phosphate decarboxylase